MITKENSCWRVVPLGKLAKIRYGKNLPTKELTESGYPVFGANGIIGFFSNYLYEMPQVLISCRGAYSGKINWSPANSFVTNNSLILEVEQDDLELKKYLYWALQGVDKSKLVTGSAQPQVTINNAEILEVPLAPKHLRTSIVSEIEKQFSRLDEAVTALKRIQANLKRYKAAVLKAAVEGKLTKEWRCRGALHAPSCNDVAISGRTQCAPTETGADLLKRILAERRAKWEAEELAKMNAKGRVGAHCMRPDDSWKKKYKEPAGPDTANLPELPEGWVWATVEQLGSTGEQPVLTGPFGSNMGKSDFRENGVPVLTIGCLREQALTLEKAMYVSEQKADELGRYQLKINDMLFSRMATVGRAGLVTRQFEGSLFNYHLMRLRLEPCGILPMYFVHYVRGAQTVTKYVREVNHGATRDGINTGQLLGLPVSLPPLKEQKFILEEIDRRLSVTEELEATIETNLKRAERLRQTILQRAFAGGVA